MIGLPGAGYNERVKLDVPDEVRRKVVADGTAAWLDELPSVVESLVQDWSLTIGGTFRGGHAAFLVEATLADGTAAVLKVGVPGTRRELGLGLEDCGDPLPDWVLHPGRRARPRR